MDEEEFIEENKFCLERKIELTRNVMIRGAHGISSPLLFRECLVQVDVLNNYHFTNSIMSDLMQYQICIS